MKAATVARTPSRNVPFSHEPLEHFSTQDVTLRAWDKQFSSAPQASKAD